MGNVALATVLRVSPVATMQSAGDGAVILLTDSGQIYTCNETTETLLNLVDGKRSLDDVIDLALEEYETDRATLEADYLQLASKLVGEGILST